MMSSSTWGILIGSRLAAAAISLAPLEASHQPSHQPADQETASIMTMKDDLANRSTDIHWPPGFDPTLGWVAENKSN